MSQTQSGATVFTFKGRRNFILSRHTVWRGLRFLADLFIEQRSKARFCHVGTMTQRTVGRMHKAIGSHTRADTARPNRQPLPFHPHAIFYGVLSSINFEPAARVAFALIF